MNSGKYHSENSFGRQKYYSENYIRKNVRKTYSLQFIKNFKTNKSKTK